MTIELEKQLSDYGITPEQAEYYQLMAKYAKEIDAFREQFMANPENGYPPTEADIKAELQRLESKEKKQALYRPGKIVTIETTSGQEDDRNEMLSFTDF